jgi:hypothetical protein
MWQPVDDRSFFEIDLSDMPATVEEYRDVAYIVRDANKFALAYVHFETEPDRRTIRIEPPPPDAPSMGGKP